MVRRCVVWGCKNTSSDGVSLHQFPTDAKQCRKWNKFVASSRKDWTRNAKHSILCSAHFVPEDFNPVNRVARNLGFTFGPPTLKPGVVPRINLSKPVMKRPGVLETRERIEMPRSGNLKRRATTFRKQEPLIIGSKKRSSVRKKSTNQDENQESKEQNMDKEAPKKESPTSKQKITSPKPKGSIKVETKSPESSEIPPTTSTEGNKKKRKRKTAEIEVTKQPKIAKSQVASVNKIPAEAKGAKQAKKKPVPDVKRKTAEIKVAKQPKIVKNPVPAVVKTPTPTVQPKKTMIDISKLAVIIGRTIEKWRLYMTKEGKRTDEEFAAFLLSIYETHVSVCMKQEPASTNDNEYQPHGITDIGLPSDEISIKEEPSTDPPHEPTCPEYSWSQYVKEEESDVTRLEDVEAESHSGTETASEFDTIPKAVKYSTSYSLSIVPNLTIEERNEPQEVVHGNGISDGNSNLTCGTVSCKEEPMDSNPMEDRLCSIESVTSLSPSECPNGKTQTDEDVDSVMDDEQMRAAYIERILGDDGGFNKWNHTEIEAASTDEVDPEAVQDLLRRPDSQSTALKPVQNPTCKPGSEAEALISTNVSASKAVDQNDAPLNPIGTSKGISDDALQRSCGTEIVIVGKHLDFAQTDILASSDENQSSDNIQSGKTYIVKIHDPFEEYNKKRDVFIKKMLLNDDSFKRCEFAGCTRYFKRSQQQQYEVHKKVHPFHESLRCNVEYCGRYYRNETSLKEHRMKYHRLDLPVRCPIHTCRKPFETQEELAQHKKTDHTIVCDFEGCGRSFEYRSGYNIHRSYHPDRLPYVCGVEGCSKRFGRMNNWTLHMRKYHPSDQTMFKYIDFGGSSSF